MSVHKLEIVVNTDTRDVSVKLDGKDKPDFSELFLSSQNSQFNFMFDLVETSKEDDLRKSTRLSASSIERIKELKRRGVSSEKISASFSISTRHVDYICAGQRCVSKNQSILQKAFDVMNTGQKKIDISQAKQSGIKIEYGSLCEQLLANLKKKG